MVGQTAPAPEFLFEGGRLHISCRLVRPFLSPGTNALGHFSFVNDAVAFLHLARVLLGRISQKFGWDTRQMGAKSARFKSPEDFGVCSCRSWRHLFSMGNQRRLSSGDDKVQGDFDAGARGRASGKRRGDGRCCSSGAKICAARSVHFVFALSAHVLLFVRTPESNSMELFVAGRPDGFRLRGFDSSSEERSARSCTDHERTGNVILRPSYSRLCARRIQACRRLCRPGCLFAPADTVIRKGAGPKR